MAAIVTNKFRLTNAEQFYESFTEEAPRYYLFVGRPQPWTANSGGGSDTAPPTPLDNVVDEPMYFRDMLAAKRITSSNISYMVPRHTWTSGVTYDYYRGDYGATVGGAVVTTEAGGTNLWSASTLNYAINSTNQIWKCLRNRTENGSSAIASTSEPIASSPPTTPTEFGDGYVWKYMYTLTTTEITDYLTADFIPIHTDATVSAAAVNGGIQHYYVDAGGSGYTDGTYTPITLYGDGSGGTCAVTVSSGAIQKVVAVATGGGALKSQQYTFANVNIDAISGIGSGTGAIVTPLIPNRGGFGYNAVTELGGYYVATNTTIAGSEGSGDFVVDQDFRRVGIVANPNNYDGSAATASTLNALHSMTFSGTPSGFVNDEVITGGTSGAKGVVVDFNAVTKILKYIQTQWTGVTSTNNLVAFAALETVTSTGGSGTIATLTNPEIQYDSGDTIYAEDRAPISRATDQTENIKLIVEF